MPLCEVCSREPSKYKCPTCGLASCSLDCTKSHKIYCAPKPSSPKPEENRPQDDSLKNEPSNKPIAIQDLGSSPELQKLFAEYPGLRGRLREIYKSTLEEEWESRPPNHHARGHKPSLWTAEKGFKRGLGQVTKWRESCEDGQSTGSDAEGFVKFMGLATGSEPG